MKILILNGPNLNLLGVREPGIYGNSSFDEYLPQLRAKYPDVEIEYYQSNIEGEMINKMQEVGFTYDGIILDAGGGVHLRRYYIECWCLYTYQRGLARLYPLVEESGHRGAYL